MLIRTRLIANSVILQLLSILVLAYGVISIQKALGRRDVDRAETQIRLAVARASTDALIQKDQVQLLSYLNFLKVQYPALTYARTVWKEEGRAASQNLGDTTASPSIVERRVFVSDPAAADRTVEVIFGINQDILWAGISERQLRMLKMLILVGGATALSGILFAILLARSLTSSISALGRLAESISDGRLGERIEWKSDDEIGALIRVFNNMSSRLADLDVAKMNFVSSVTHELRSPLGAIESFLPLIREKALSPDKKVAAVSLEYMDRVDSNVKRLNRFITDLLDVAKIERGKMECVLSSVDLNPIATEVFQFFEQKARAQGITLENKLKDTPPVLADADRIRQVLVNLLANALKFTPPNGTVRLSGEIVRDAQVRWLEVAMTDNGAGMEESDRRRLFSPFTQGRNVSEGFTGTRGTGLGLFIVKSIIDQHGGRLEVKSAPQKGTRVTFTLRVAG